MSRKTFFAALAAVCIVLAGCGGDSAPASSTRSTSGGQRASAGGQAPGATRGAGGASLFRLPMADGQPVTVKTPAALFFFTSWCGYCKRVMPEVKRLAEAGQARGWRVYGIQVAEGPMQTNNFVQQYQPNFPVLMDQQSMVSSQYKVKGYPTFVLIDENANIIYNGHEPPRNFR